MSACSAIATFLAGRKLSRIGIESDTSSSSTVARAGELLGALDLEVVGREPHRRARALAPDRVLDRLLDVRGGTGRRTRRACARTARSWPTPVALDLVPAGAVLHQLAEQVAERLLADAPGCPCGVSSSRPSRCSMSPASSSILASSREPLERRGPRRRRAARGPGRGRPRRARPGCVALRSRCSRSSMSPSVSSRPGIWPSCSGSSPRKRIELVPRHVAGTPAGGSGRAGRPASAGPCPRAATRRAPGAARAARASSSSAAAASAPSSCAICSSSSSSVCGLPGKKSP